MISNKFKIWENYEKNDHDFQLAQKKFTQIFYEYYNQGFHFYINGNWKSSKKYLQKAEMELGEKDGPAQFLIEYMSGFEFESPENWIGGRHAGL